MGPELFGVGFAEAVLVLVIALIVVGPHRFPEVARNGGRWYRKARRFTAEVTSDLRAAMSELEQEVTAEAGDLRSIRELGSEVEADLKQTEQELSRGDRPAAQAPPGASEHSGPGQTSSATRPSAAAEAVQNGPDVAAPRGRTDA